MVKLYVKEISTTQNTIRDTVSLDSFGKSRSHFAGQGEIEITIKCHVDGRDKASLDELRDMIGQRMIVDLNPQEPPSIPFKQNFFEADYPGYPITTSTDADVPEASKGKDTW